MQLLAQTILIIIMEKSLELYMSNVNDRLHHQQVVQSSVLILSVLAFSALGPVKHTHKQKVKIMSN